MEGEQKKPTGEEMSADAKEWVEKNFPAKQGNSDFKLQVVLLLNEPLAASQSGYVSKGDREFWLKQETEHILLSVSRLRSVGVSDGLIKGLIRKAFSYPGVTVPIPPETEKFLRNGRRIKAK